jgi:hypothetical protein
MTPEEERLAALTNEELVEELAVDADVPDELWVEVGLRLGVEGLHGIRAAAIPGVSTGDQAERLRRFMALWELERRRPPTPSAHGNGGSDAGAHP